MYKYGVQTQCMNVTYKCRPLVTRNSKRTAHRYINNNNNNKTSNRLNVAFRPFEDYIFLPRRTLKGNNLSGERSSKIAEGEIF